MIYSKSMRQAVHAIKVPHKFIMDVVEFPTPDGGFLMLRFYGDQWEAFSEMERGECAEYLARVKSILESHGVLSTLDPVIGSPPHDLSH